MPILIPLGMKYRRAYKGRYKGGENPAPKKKRNKIGLQKHMDRQGVPPQMVMVVDGYSGKARMQRA
jgi:hypothetical protein